MVPTSETPPDSNRSNFELLDSQLRMRSLIQAADVGLWDWDLLTNAVYFSPEWKRQLGYADSELPNRFEEWGNRLHPEDRAATIAAVDDYREGRRPFYDAEFRMRHKDGSWRWIFARADFERDASGRPVRMMGCHFDITARKQAETALRESEERLKYALDATRDGLWDWNIATGAVHFSPQWARLLGYMPGEVPNRVEFFFTVLHPDDVDRVRQILGDHLKGKTLVKQDEVRLRMKTGEYRWFYDRGEVVTRDANGNPLRMVGTITDITERKQMEALLNIQKVVLQRIASGAPLKESMTVLARMLELQEKGIHCSILLLDTDGMHLRHVAAPSLPEAYGMAVDGMEIGAAAGCCGTAAYRREPVFAEDIATDPLWVNFRELAMRHGLRSCWSMPILSGSGKVLGTFAIYNGKPGQPTAQVQEMMRLATSVAVTAISKHHAESALRVSDLALKSISQGVLISSVDGQILSVNPAFTAITGYSEAELHGKTCKCLHGPLTDPATTDRMKVARRNGVAFAGEILDYRKDGTTFWNELAVMPVRDDQGQLTQFIGVMREITERKLAETKLQESETRLRDAQAISRIGNFQWDAESNAVTWSDELYRVYGRERERFTPTFDTYVAAVHPDDRPGVLQSLQDAMETGKGFEHEYRILLPGGELRWVHARGHAIIDKTGECKGLEGTCQDITERKQAEEARASLEAQLRESQKMQAIGTLAGGIAHDFNNIIATILGNANLALEDAGANQPVLQSLEEIRKAGTRALDLVHQIVAFSRRQPTTLRKTDLGEVVRESARLLRATLPARIALDVQCDAAVPGALADATQIGQVLINLATNAMQAIVGRPGRIAIRLDTIVPDAGLASANQALRALHEANPGRVLRLTVGDDGVGMDAATKARIFEPFFTTKPVGEGTGLGLSVVHGIVQQHGGAIVVDSQPGIGTTFTVYLPSVTTVAGSQGPDSALGEEKKADTSGTQHVLYIDDEEALLYLVRRVLGRNGYRISTFISAAEAIKAFGTNPSAYDLVLTDYNMPGMSGLDVAREIRAQRSDIPIGVMSGFVDEELRAEAAGAGVHEVFAKSHDLNDVSVVVKRLLQPDTRMPRSK